MSGQPPSDYDGWPLSESTAVRCPDCDQESGETDQRDVLLAWIDAHECTGYATNFEETSNA